MNFKRDLSYTITLTEDEAYELTVSLQRIGVNGSEEGMLGELYSWLGNRKNI